MRTILVALAGGLLICVHPAAHAQAKPAAAKPEAAKPAAAKPDPAKEALDKAMDKAVANYKKNKGEKK